MEKKLELKKDLFIRFDWADVDLILSIHCSLLPQHITNI